MATRKTSSPPTPSPAKKAAAPGLGDLGKLLENFKLPGIDVSAIVEAQRKDMEALAEANRLAYEGIVALAERRNEILTESLSELQESMEAMTGPDVLSKQAALAKKRIERAMANIRELTDMEAETRNKAWKVVKDRFLENQANLMQLFKPK